MTCDPEIVIFSGKHIPNIACDPRIIAGNILTLYLLSDVLSRYSDV